MGDLGRREAILAMAAAGAVALAPGMAAAARNASGFVVHDLADHFDSVGVGAILCDTRGRKLQYWSPDGLMRVYATSVPISDELTKLGRTEIVRKTVAPTWTPTPSMRERFPDWPATMPGGDPRNPLGTHAMYLSWPYYLIHGTHDTRKIGRRSSDGCIGLYNEQIAELYALAEVGTQVKLI